MTRREPGARSSVRRQLVRLLETLLAFPEYFEVAEDALLTLTLEETEEGLSNNATGIWKAAFRVSRSGTALPFSDRWAVLSRRLGTDAATAALVLDAIQESFKRWQLHRVARPALGGRLPPPQWRPASTEEERACWSLVLDALLERMAPSFAHSGAALEVLIQGLPTFLGQDLLKRLESSEALAALEPTAKARLIGALDRYLWRADQLRFSGSEVSEVHRAVAAWRESLRGDGLMDRLLVEIGESPWRKQVQLGAEDWRATLEGLADALLAEGGFSPSVRGWLSTREARGAGPFGAVVGERDPEAALLPLLFSAWSAPSTRFLEGYIAGLLARHPRHIGAVEREVERVEESDAAVAFTMRVAAGRSLRLIPWALAAVDEGRQPPSALVLAARRVGVAELNDDELVAILTQLKSHLDDPEAMVSGSELFGEILHWRRQDNHALPPDMEGLAWDFFEADLRADRAEMYRWKLAQDLLMRGSSGRIAAAAVKALTSRNLYTAEVGEELCKGLLTREPTTLMEKLGEAMLAKRTRWGLRARHVTAVLTAMPVEVVTGWLEGRGVEGARSLAGFLPRPVLRGGAGAEVAPLTAFVLGRFEEDEEVFESFLVGREGRFYSGDVAGQHAEEAERARAYLDHPVRRIREWAVHQIEAATYGAERWREEDEERRIPS